MTMHRFEAPVAFPIASQPGIGFSASGPTPLTHNLMPQLDFYDGATFLFRFVGFYWLTAKNTSFRVMVDTLAAGSVITYASTTWPTNLDRIRFYRKSDGEEFGADLTSSTFSATQQFSGEGYDKGGNTSRFLSINGDGTTQDTDASGNLMTAGEKFVFEISGDFTHVVETYNFSPYQLNTAYDATHIFSAQENNADPKYYILDASASASVLDNNFTDFLTRTGVGITTSADVAGGQVFGIKPLTAFGKDIYDASGNVIGGNLIELKGTEDTTNDIIVLRDEPLIYYNASAGSNGSGRSRQDPYNTLPALSDNTPVLDMGGSTVGGTTTPDDDAVVVVQNGAIASSGGGGGVVSSVIQPLVE